MAKAIKKAKRVKTLMAKERKLEKPGTKKTAIESRLEQKISKITGKKYIGRR